MAAPRRLRANRAGSPTTQLRASVRVEDDFTDEYPDADPTCTELSANLILAGELMFERVESVMVDAIDVSHGVAVALAVIDGAEGPLTPTEISQRTLVATATITATLDTLQRRGWIQRTPNPIDRRSLLIEITPAGRIAADAMLPRVHYVERQLLSVLDETERRQLLGLLERVINRIADPTTVPVVIEPERKRRTPISQ